ncbi:hypothetical protein EVAR_47482_1 [Eumeta japonica]|uniref:Uncharacterized protein n=1 Tax=Eumeta variegata TaxID=151549 RepID=A0A4C1XE92_EUMVA|nr:hypothetical protein EVAR_47482_1 [Eumeta japonica]
MMNGRPSMRRGAGARAAGPPKVYEVFVHYGGRLRFLNDFRRPRGRRAGRGRTGERVAGAGRGSFNLAFNSVSESGRTGRRSLLRRRRKLRPEIPKILPGHRDSEETNLY